MDTGKKVIVTYTDGELFIDSSHQVMGLQIFFSGGGQIGFDLPDGWFYARNDTQIILTSLDKSAIENGVPFMFYTGYIDINLVVAVFSDLTKQRIERVANTNPKGYISNPTDQIKQKAGKIKVANVGATKISEYTINEKGKTNHKPKHWKLNNKEEIYEKFRNTDGVRYDGNKNRMKARALALTETEDSATGPGPSVKTVTQSITGSTGGGY